LTVYRIGPKIGIDLRADAPDAGVA